MRQSGTREKLGRSRPEIGVLRSQLVLDYQIRAVRCTRFTRGFNESEDREVLTFACTFAEGQGEGDLQIRITRGEGRRRAGALVSEPRRNHLKYRSRVLRSLAFCIAVFGIRPPSAYKSHRYRIPCPDILERTLVFRDMFVSFL